MDLRRRAGELSRRLSLVVAAVAALPLAGHAGCSSDGPVELAPLVDHPQWEATTDETDPFVADKPADASCDTDTGYAAHLFAGESALEILTDRCNYLTMTQPSRANLREGAPLKVRLWHFELESADPAKAHAAISVGEKVVWETTIDIPAAPQLIVDTQPSPVSAPEGTPVYFHLHNHGKNAWALLEISAER